MDQEISDLLSSSQVENAEQRQIQIFRSVKLIKNLDFFLTKIIEECIIRSVEEACVKEEA